jgi:hypothetical protein
MVQDPVTSQQPRLPGSTSEQRDAIWQRLFGIESSELSSLLPEAHPVPIPTRITPQSLRLGAPYVVLNSAIAIGESLTVDLQVQLPGTFPPVSVLSAPLVLDSSAPVGAQIPLPILPSALDSLLPMGSAIYVDRGVVGAGAYPNTVVVPLLPAT